MIPEGKAARPVRISLVVNVAVVDAVHPRRRDEARQNPLDPFGQSEIAMVEQDREEEPALPYSQGARGNPDQGDLRGSIGSGNCHISRVEA